MHDLVSIMLFKLPNMLLSNAPKFSLKLCPTVPYFDPSMLLENHILTALSGNLIHLQTLFFKCSDCSMRVNWSLVTFTSSKYAVLLYNFIVHHVKIGGTVGHDTMKPTCTTKCLLELVYDLVLHRLCQHHLGHNR